MLSLPRHTAVSPPRVSPGRDYVRVALPVGTLRLVHRHVSYCAVGRLGFEIGVDGVDYVLFRDSDAAFALVHAVQDLAPHLARLGTLAPTVLAVDLVCLAAHQSAGSSRVLPRGWSRTHLTPLVHLAGEQPPSTDARVQ